MGEMALRLIVLTLFISSLSEFKKFRFLFEVRRMIGLFAFFYVSCHFLTYVALDHFFDMTFIIKDIIKRPFITFGFISFIFLIPLAITSPKIMLKKLGFKVWKKIHYLIYPAAMLSSIHFYMLVHWMFYTCFLQTLTFVHTSIPTHGDEIQAMTCKTWVLNMTIIFNIHKFPIKDYQIYDTTNLLIYIYIYIYSTIEKCFYECFKIIPN